MQRAFAPLLLGAGLSAFLCERGLSLRGVAGYGLPHCLRLTVGTEDANRRVVAALGEFLGRSK